VPRLPFVASTFDDSRRMMACCAICQAFVVTQYSRMPSGKESTIPLTAIGAVKMVITEAAVFECEAGQLVLTELLGDATLAWVRSHTTAPFVERLSSDA
jgi:3-oxoacid CoA-transferase